MCGRFSLIADLRELGERFGFDPGGLTHPPRYNAAPTQPVLAVMNGDGRHAEHLSWGLVPSWARSASVGSRLINARAETAAELPSFRTAFSRRRCLVLAGGFYEWRRSGNSRIPMRIVMKSGEPFAFAGLWDSWQDPEGEDGVEVPGTVEEVLDVLVDPEEDVWPELVSAFWLRPACGPHVLLSGGTRRGFCGGSQDCGTPCLRVAGYSGLTDRRSPPG